MLTHFYSSSDLHCSRTILASFVSQVKKTTKPIHSPPPPPRKRCSKTPQINDVEKPQSMLSASSLPGALLCLSASASVSRQALVLPYNCQPAPKGSQEMHQKESSGWISNIPRQGKLQSPPYARKISWIPNCKSQVRFQISLSFNNCLILNVELAQ